MNPVQMIGQLGELGTVGLLIALVLLFVVAFKVLEMVMQTVLVAALSGGFYFALSYYLSSVAFSFNSLLFFAFIGGSLYTGYHLIAQGYAILTLLLSIPIKAGKVLVKNLRKLYGAVAKKLDGTEEKLKKE